MTHSNALPVDSVSAGELGSYRSLSTLAVVAFVLGLISPVVFISPLLLVLPLAAVGTALLALAKISASSGGLSGAGLARCGFALAIVFGVAATARITVRNELFRRQAAAAARQWLSLVAANQIEKAADMLTYAARERLRPPSPPGQRAPAVDRSQAAALLRQDPLVRILVPLQQQKHLIFTCRKATTVANSGGKRVQCTYKITNSPAAPAALIVAVRRSQGAQGRVDWLIDAWSTVPAKL